ncbi:MAG: hypothetical protein GY851_25255 [bacterium]|nr:hypothetical protein [bacterium]
MTECTRRFDSAELIDDAAMDDTARHRRVPIRWAGSADTNPLMVKVLKQLGGETKVA